MKMKSKWIISGGIAFVLIVLLAFSISSVDSVNSDINALKDNLVEQGIKVKSLSLNGKDLQAKIQSDGIDRLTPEDIRAIRNIRNEVRNPANQEMGIQNLSILILGKQGNTMYDVTINDITVIPEFVRKPKPRLKTADVEDVLHHALENEGYAIASVKVENSPLEGKLAEMVIKVEDIAAVDDSMMPEIELLISELNDSTGTGITQYNLSLEDKTGEQIIYLTADLIYRDFYWWQSPLLSERPWTKDKPEKPAI